jgi:hypothetical protein
MKTDELKIPEKSAALIIHEDFSTELHLPKQKDNDIVHDNSIAIVLLGILFTKQDEDFLNLIIEKKKQYNMV